MIIMYCRIYKEAIRQRKALSRTSSNIVLNSVHHHRSSTRHHHHQQMLLQAAADTGELALHTAHFTVPTELHAVNGEWNSVCVCMYVRVRINHIYDDAMFSWISRTQLITYATSRVAPVLHPMLHPFFLFFFLSSSSIDIALHRVVPILFDHSEERIFSIWTRCSKGETISELSIKFTVGTLTFNAKFPRLAR